MLHGNTSCFELPREGVKACSIGDLPPEKALGIWTLSVNDDSLATIIHTECRAGNPTVDQLQPQLARSEVGPLIDVLCADIEIAECLNCHERCSRSALHLQLGMSRRELFETFWPAPQWKTIEQKLRGFVSRVPKLSAYSHKARTATKQPPLRYRHETDMPSRTAHVR
jgi:hypothetical protein